MKKKVIISKEKHQNKKTVHIEDVSLNKFYVASVKINDKGQSYPALLCNTKDGFVWMTTWGLYVSLKVYPDLKKVLEIAMEKDLIIIQFDTEKEAIRALSNYLS